MTTSALIEREAPPARRVPGASNGMGVVDAVVLLLAALLPIAYLPGLGSSFWAPKAALLLFAIPPGLLVLGRAGVRRDRASLAAVAFLAVCALSTFLAADPVAALVGLHDADGGLLFIGACAGAWAMARELSPAGRRLLIPALLTGVAVTSAVAWLQMTVGLSAEGLEPFGGTRAGALQGNPVFVGGLTAAGICLATAWTGLARLPWLRAGLVLLFAGALQLSGSRVALVPVVVVLVWAVWKLGWRSAALVATAVLIGVVGARALTSSDDAATDRSAQSSADLATRFQIWELGTDAFFEAPVLGTGPATFRSATSPEWTRDLAQAHGPDVLLLDAHNVLVEYLVTTGLVGALLGAAWLALALRRARGPLLWFAGALAASWLVQPQGVDTTPLLMIAIGAAAVATLGPEAAALDAPDAPNAASLDVTDAGAKRWHSLLALSLIPGLVAGAWLIVGERQLSLGEQGSRSALDRAESMIGFFPVVQATITEREIVRGVELDMDARAAAIRSARATVDIEPTRPDWWNRLGEVEGEWGSPRASRRAFERALQLNPWSVRASGGLLTLARMRGDDETATEMTERLCDLSEATCPKERRP